MNKVVLFNNCTKKVLILICLVMILSLFSCSNVLLDNDLSQNQDEVLVTFSINSGSGNSSRTILPKIISNEEINSGNYVYILSGKSTRGETIEKEFETDSITIALSRTVWELNLELFEKTETEKVLLMEDTIVEDFSDGINSITFSLSDKKVSKETKGGCDLTIKFADSENSVSSVKVELLNISTGTAQYSKDDFEISTVDGQKSINYVNDEITHGQYILKVDFYDSNSELLACWCDVLFIAAGLTSTSETTVSDNFFGTKPSAPSNLTATINTTDSTLDFSWTDNSNNENQFNIYVYKYESEESTEGTLVGTYYAFAGDTTYSITLESGIYGAKISSQNKFGESEESLETKFTIE